MATERFGSEIKLRGRPAGGGSVATKEVVSETVAKQSVCKGCGSQDRTAYNGCTEMTHAGVTTTWKRTKCTSCGQSRVDIFKTKAVATL